MRVANLARRPFINRRPIVRFAALLWLAGILLLAWNVRLYSGHWQGTAENRRLLEAAQSKLSAERQNRDLLAARLTGVNLREQNRQSMFLNSLISYRTFPWSALFDDLEEVLPAEVKLFNVQPVVRLATEVARENRLAARRRAAAERDNRRTARSRRQGSSAAAPAEAEPAPRPEPEQQLAPDEVALQLNGQAKTEDALIELVDRLFENSAFRRPVLDSEHFDANQKVTVFSLFVVYLTRREPVIPVAEEGLEPELAAAEAAEPPPGTGAPDRPAGDAGLERGALPRAAGAADAAGARPDLSAETSDRETSDRGTSDRVTSGRGASGRGASGRGASIAGAPGRGAPGADPSGRRVPATGAPDRGAPDDASPRLADRESSDTDSGRGREEREAEGPGEAVDDEPGLGERDASSTPALDNGGQVRLRPGSEGDRPGLVRLASSPGQKSLTVLSQPQSSEAAA